MNIRTITAALSVTLIFTGCASGPQLQLYEVPTTVVIIPAINTQASAEIGQTIISKANVRKIPAIRIANSVSENINLTSITSIGAGTIPLHATGETGKYYRHVDTAFVGSGIFVPHDKSLPAVIYLAPRPGNYGKNPVSGIEYIDVEKWSQIVLSANSCIRVFLRTLFPFCTESSATILHARLSRKN